MIQFVRAGLAAGVVTSDYGLVWQRTQPVQVGALRGLKKPRDQGSVPGPPGAVMRLAA